LHRWEYLERTMTRELKYEGRLRTVLLLFGFTLGGVRVASAHQIPGRDLGGGARVLFLEPWPGAQRLALRAIDTRLGEQKDPALAAAGADSERKARLFGVVEIDLRFAGRQLDALYGGVGELDESLLRFGPETFSLVGVRHETFPAILCPDLCPKGELASGHSRGTDFDLWPRVAD
jgi:hypothetical protein